MKLSEAFILASMVETPVREHDWDHCALGCAGNVAGVPPEIEVTLMGTTFSLHERPDTLVNKWPWLNEENKQYHDTYLWQISNMFEDGVSLTEIANYVRAVEPECGQCCRFDCTCEKAVQQEETETVAQ